MRSIHEARRLRQAGDVDTALAVLAGVDTAKAERHQVRWVYAEWTDLVKRMVGDRDVLVYSQATGQGRRPGSPGRRRGAGGRGGAGDALAAGQARLAAQPAGPPAPERRCVMVTANVDIAALKARHPLGDTVEAAGSPSPWKGPGPPGRLPLPRRGGGQLHGVRRLGAVLLLRLRRGGRRPGLHPEVRGAEPPGGHRAAGRQPRACARGRHSSSRTAASRVRRGASPRPRPADGGGALLRRRASGATQKRGSTWPRGASAPPPQPASVSAMRRAAGCGRPWSPWASPSSVSGTPGCSWPGERSGSPAWSSSPTSPAAS